MAKKTMWGGRFKKQMHPLLKCFSYSMMTDQHLLEAEIQVNLAWIKMLGRAKLISAKEASRLTLGMKRVAKSMMPKNPHGGIDAKYIRQYEDIHSALQTELEKKIGTLGKKLHTARSRNDLVITSTRIYLRKKIEVIIEKIGLAQKALVSKAKRRKDVVIPGFTHLKRAQPLLLAHHLLAYVEMLEEDKDRLRDLQKRVDVLPLGSAALAGSSLPIDQKFLARQLGFSKIATNSLKAVSDRGVLTEFLAGLSILWMHLSRLSEDFILWNSEQFNFVQLDDAFASGSSLMPQKKNPDVFELIRGRAGVIFGHLQALLTVQKGLPLAYNRDLQEDKPGLFDAVQKTEIALELLGLTVSTVTFNREVMDLANVDDTMFATDILEYLVKKKLPFKEAHALVGKIVQYAIDRRKPMRALSLDEWKRFSKDFDLGVYDLFNTKASVRAKKTIGSTHPNRVKSAISKWERVLKHA